MYAIVEIAGHQFKVEKDQRVFVNRLSTEEGEKVSFDNVLLIDNGGNITLGAPAIDGAQVSAKVLKHLKGDKVIVFKKKRRKGYRVKNGHRQALTEIVIEDITASGAKKAPVKKETKVSPSTTAKKEVKEAAPKGAAKPNADRETVNFGEDHELNYHLKKNGLSQSIANRKALTDLGTETKERLGKNILTHEDVDEAIIANIDRFKALKSK